MESGRFVRVVGVAELVEQGGVHAVEEYAALGQDLACLGVDQVGLAAAAGSAQVEPVLGFAGVGLSGGESEPHGMELLVIAVGVAFRVESAKVMRRSIPVWSCPTGSVR